MSNFGVLALPLQLPLIPLIPYLGETHEKRLIFKNLQHLCDLHKTTCIQRLNTPLGDLLSPQRCQGVHHVRQIWIDCIKRVKVEMPKIEKTPKLAQNKLK